MYTFYISEHMWSFVKTKGPDSQWKLEKRWTRS